MEKMRPVFFLLPCIFFLLPCFVFSSVPCVTSLPGTSYITWLTPCLFDMATGRRCITWCNRSLGGGDVTLTLPRSLWRASWLKARATTVCCLRQSCVWVQMHLNITWWEAAGASHDVMATLQSVSRDVRQTDRSICQLSGAWISVNVTSLSQWSLHHVMKLTPGTPRLSAELASTLSGLVVKARPAQTCKMTLPGHDPAGCWSV